MKKTMDLNKWQKHYIDTLYDGKMPKSKVGREELGLLSKVRDTVTVHFPDFQCANRFEPAHTETFKVELDECNVPKGIISVEVLAGNLNLWEGRGYQIDY